MKASNNQTVYLDKATKNVLTSLLEEIDLGNYDENELKYGQAYIILNRDNPNTKEILGSVSLILPYAIDSKSKEELEKMNIPAVRSFLSCFGVFDARSDGEGNGLKMRCVIRNEHGYPLSLSVDRLAKKSIDLNERIGEIVKKELQQGLKDEGV